LMDTQGMFDNETTMTLTAQIFGISTLISSLQIYNIQNRISEDHLQHLALFSEYGRIAHQQQRGDEKVSEDTQSWFSSSAPKPFQRLQFLVRDWANFDEAWPEIGPDEAGANPEEARARQTQSYNKLREEMQTYLTKLIKTRGDASLQSTRDQIARCFERVDCFLLPHPGIPVTKPNYDGSLKALDQGFRGLLDQFARLVFDEQLEPKRVQKRYITGIELANYFEAYVKLFQSGEGFPKAMTILEATAEANNRNAYDLAVNKYTEVMGPITGKGANETFLREAELRVSHALEYFLYLLGRSSALLSLIDQSPDPPNSPHSTPPRSQAKHKNAEEQALAVFADIATMGSPDGARIMQDLLVKFFVAEIDQRLNVNSLRNPFKDYEKYVIPAVVAIVSWILSVLLNATCSTTICKKLERNFVGVYVLFLIFVAFAMRNKLQTIFAYLRLLGAELGIGEKLKAS